MKIPSLRRRKLPSCLSVVFLFAVHAAYAQTAKTFWFAAPDLLTSYESPIYLRVTALGTNATVTISEPANPSFSVITHAVAANSNYTFDLSSAIAQVENTGSNVVQNKGILVTSTADILAYYEAAKSDNPELFALKGTNALGTSFVVPSMKRFSAGTYGGSHRTMFYAVATADNTVVTVTPAVDLVGHTVANGSFNVTLNTGQVYCGESASTTVHIGGTAVTATQPIAITYSSDLAGAGSCADLDGDQVIPVSLAGQNFITMPGYLSGVGGTDFVYIYPTQNATAITINGVAAGTKNKGEYLESISNNQTLVISTDKPVIIYQLSGYICELGGGVVPTIDCTGSTLVGVTRSTTDNFYMNLLVKTGGEGSFTFNGSSSVITATDFTDVPNTSGAWKYARKQITTAQLAAGAGAIIQNASPFHLGIVQVGAGGASYGYFSNFRSYQPDVSFTNNGTVCGTTATTSVLSTIASATAYQWNLNGTAIPGATSSSYTAADAGIYSVDVTYDAQCPQSRSTDITLTSSCTLPLHFTTFNATSETMKNTLQWETENETQVAYFDVERSSDGAAYAVIGNMKAKNLKQKSQYAFDDMAPLEGNNFYRLKQVDDNGKITYSAVVKLDHKISTKLTLFPNPVAGELHLQPHLTGATLTVSIYNASGSLIQARKVLNQSYLTVPVQHLSTGTYRIEVSNDTETQRAQFIRK